MATDVDVLVGDGSLGYGAKYCSSQSNIHPSQRGVVYLMLKHTYNTTISYHCTYIHMHIIRTTDYISQHIPYKFHSLCAGEAAHLSSDFRRICETYFPHAELAQIIVRQHTGTPQAQQRVSMVKAAQ